MDNNNEVLEERVTVGTVGAFIVLGLIVAAVAVYVLLPIV